MSIAAVSWVFEQDIRPSSVKFVLLALADHAGQSGDDALVWPCIDTIARKTSQDRKTVISAIDELCGAGWLRETAMRKGATGQVKVYSIVGLTSSATHYVYRLDDPSTGEFYIGVRSCLGAPEEDTNYMGSGKWCNSHPDIRRVKKTIVHAFETREEAAAFEAAEIRRNSADPLCGNKQFRSRNSSAFDAKESRFSAQRVPFLGHGTVIEPSEEHTPIIPKQVAPIGAPSADRKLDKSKPSEKGPLQLRAESLLRRRKDTPLSVAESKAFRAAKPCIVATSEEEWLALERFYGAPQQQTFARKSLATLLNNWNGEVERAKAWCAERKIALSSLPSSAMQRPEDIDPPRWREYITETYPGHPYAIGGEQANASWKSIDRQNRKMLMEEIKQWNESK